MRLPTSSAIAGVALLTTLSFAQEQVPLTSHPKPIAEIPPIGFGTWNLDKSNASTVVLEAFKTGYRHIDCAAIYGNEKEVGHGIAAAMHHLSLKREDFWITSKLWNNMHSPSDVPKALNQTLSDLGLDYLDLYLMHWPVASSHGSNKISYLPTWTAMTFLTKPAPSPGDPAGPTRPLVRHIGVSNFSPEQMKAVSKIHKPYAHQYESHPYLPQPEFLAMHKKHGVHVTAYSPLGNANPTYGTARKEASAGAVPPLLENEVVVELAGKRGCTPAQVALRWGMGRGTSVIPKSAHVGRIREDWEAVGCPLEEEDYEVLASSLPVKRFNNPSKGWGVPLYEGLQDALAEGVAAKVGKVAEGVRDVWDEVVGRAGELAEGLFERLEL